MKNCPYCETFNALLEENLLVSFRYHQATATLLKHAGNRDRGKFAGAKALCENCLEQCRRTVLALRTHKLEHGC